MEFMKDKLHIKPVHLVVGSFALVVLLYIFLVLRVNDLEKEIDNVQNTQTRVQKTLDGLTESSASLSRSVDKLVEVLSEQGRKK